MSDTLVRGGWREVSTRRWLASAVALGVDYCLEAGEGVFRRGTAWSLVWDCPHCERRVRLEAYWEHTTPCGERCLCREWSGECACSAHLTIALFYAA